MHNAVAVFHPHVVSALVGFHGVVVPRSVCYVFLGVACIDLGGGLLIQRTVSPGISAEVIGSDRKGLAADPSEARDLLIGGYGDSLDRARHYGRA